MPHLTSLLTESAPVRTYYWFSPTARKLRSRERTHRFPAIPALFWGATDATDLFNATCHSLRNFRLKVNTWDEFFEGVDGGQVIWFIRLFRDNLPVNNLARIVNNPNRTRQVTQVRNVESHFVAK